MIRAPFYSRAVLCILVLMICGCVSLISSSKQQLASHPIKTLEYWGSSALLPLEERVFPAPKELVEYLELDNKEYGFEGHPAAATADDALRRDLTNAIASLPHAVKALCESKLIGIFLVTGLGSSGFAESARQPGKPSKGFIVLDVEFLNRRANEWATFKESSAFVAETGAELQLRIEDGAGDTREGALRYILLHELGHIVSIDAGLIPPWHLAPSEVKEPDDFFYFAESWFINRDNYERHIELSEPMPGKLVFYRNVEGKPSLAQAPAFYDWLEKTSFATLYAATNPDDDFADAFANYVHVVLLKKPYAVTLRTSSGIKTYAHCWNAVRCQKKRALFETFLAHSSPN